MKLTPRLFKGKITLKKMESFLKISLKIKHLLTPDSVLVLELWRPEVGCDVTRRSADCLNFNSTAFLFLGLAPMKL